jgi:hypothetical protein
MTSRESINNRLSSEAKLNLADLLRSLGERENIYAAKRFRFTFRALGC